MKPYDPHSPDSMFTLVLQRLDAQDKILQRIDERGDKTEREVAKLKEWRENLKTKIATTSALVSVAVAAAWDYALRKL